MKRVAYVTLGSDAVIHGDALPHESPWKGARYARLRKGDTLGVDLLKSHYGLEPWQVPGSTVFYRIESRLGNALRALFSYLEN